MAAVRQTIDWLRHGEPEGGRKYRGAIDDPLSRKGWRQMRSAVSGPAPWQYIVTSPLLRCRAFAEELAQQKQLPLRMDERLREVGFGCWEGKSSADLQAEDSRQLADFYHDPISCRPAQAEPLDQFVARVAEASDAIWQESCESVLVVAHAGVIRAAIAHSLNLPLQNLYRLSIANAAISRLSRSSERPDTLEFMNRRSL
ncbi:MAG: histidine phosphatase family protein [gamma proteobacterium symbiont of Bathyaustriella thionipta]|nr:histidine phosphatase family protein [gamma proteobacterium symbiont of Bathyaustriella thionipta]